MDVLFLGGPLADGPHSTWYPSTDTTFVARTRGRISQICLTRDPETIATLFDQPGFDWSQQAQFGLLFPPDLQPSQINPNLTAEAIAHEKIDAIPHLLAYLRPGDDGDFAALAFLDASTLHLWTDSLAAIALGLPSTYDNSA